MARSPPRFTTITVTSTDNAIALSNAKLWLLGGLMKVATASVDLGAAPGGGTFNSYAAGVDVALSLTPLHQLLLKSTAAGVPGTVTILGTVVDREEDFIAYTYGGS